MYIPKEETKRAQFMNLVNQSVTYMKEMDVLKEDIKEERNAAVEMFGCTAKQFNQVVKVVYNRAKTEEQIEDLETALSNAEILLGEREYPDEDQEEEEEDTEQSE